SKDAERVRVRTERIAEIPRRELRARRPFPDEAGAGGIGPRVQHEARPEELGGATAGHLDVRHARTVQPASEARPACVGPAPLGPPRVRLARGAGPAVVALLARVEKPVAAEAADAVERTAIGEPGEVLQVGRWTRLDEPARRRPSRRWSEP